MSSASTWDIPSELLSAERFREHVWSLLMYILRNTECFQSVDFFGSLSYMVGSLKLHVPFRLAPDTPGG